MILMSKCLNVLKFHSQHLIPFLHFQYVLIIIIINIFNINIHIILCNDVHIITKEEDNYANVTQINENEKEFILLYFIIRNVNIRKTNIHFILF